MYGVVAVLLSAGDHVPEMLFVEVPGSADKVPPEQIGATWVKVGVVLAFTVTVVAEDVEEQPLLLVTTTVYEPAVVAV